MRVTLHRHARERLLERGATEAEVVETVEQGDCFSAKFGRTGFQRAFAYGRDWRGNFYASKEISAFAVPDGDGWLVITIICRYF